MRVVKFIIVFILTLSLFSCDNVTTSVGLNIGSYNFNRIGSNGEFEYVSDDLFNKGETIYLMLFDVSGFKPGKDNLHSLDIDMAIKDAKGNEIYSEKGMLGENGHVSLPNNTAANPYVSYNIPSDLQSGEYSFYVKIYDNIGGGYASVSKKFTVK
ncbi:MAG: hypothetical protein Kow0068_19400 [Marinilabiliales bacterium]